MPTRTPRTRSRAGHTTSRGRAGQGQRMSSLHDLFEEELRDLYSAGQRIVNALPKMAGAASSVDLRRAFEHHLEETQRHVERLQSIFERQSITARAKKCEGMEGILKEGAELTHAKAEPQVKDAGLIGAAQKAEHYEMAGYGTVRTFAQDLGERDIADMLQETLNEEGTADEKLTQIAEPINESAAEAPSGPPNAALYGVRAEEDEMEDDEEEPE
jgi:ferritin-like metal-binding protein YciE